MAFTYGFLETRAQQVTTEGEAPEWAQQQPFPAPPAGCPSGYGTIYKYDGSTECIDPTTPDIADVIATETQGGPVDRATLGVADTLKTGVNAVKGAVSELGAVANPFGSWTAALVWVAVLGGSLYALARVLGR